MVNGSIVKGKYKYAEGTPIRTHKVRLVNDCHIFPNSVSRNKHYLLGLCFILRTDHNSLLWLMGF